MKAIIIHRWGGNPESDWYPWLKKQLEYIGIDVIIPKMPNTEKPEMNAWISHLKKSIGNLNENIFFIGHSVGCQAIMRYLEKEDYKGRVSKVILVAGWFKLDNLEDREVIEIAEPWINTPIDFNKVKDKIDNLIVFLSSNEPYNYITENKIIFEEKLGAKVIILKNKGHFTSDDKIIEFPEIIKEIKTYL